MQGLHQPADGGKKMAVFGFREKQEVVLGLAIPATIGAAVVAIIDGGPVIWFIFTVIFAATGGAAAADVWPTGREKETGS